MSVVDFLCGHSGPAEFSVKLWDKDINEIAPVEGNAQAMCPECFKAHWEKICLKCSNCGGYVSPGLFRLLPDDRVLCNRIGRRNSLPCNRFGADMNAVLKEDGSYKRLTPQPAKD